MTSKFFFCSRQRAMLLAKEVLSEMKLRMEIVDSPNNRIQATQGRRFLTPAREVEINMYSDSNRVEIAVNVESRMKSLDFGSSEYMEEEILERLQERLN